MKHKKFGFTLLEILLVVAAIGILAAIVIVAINPNEQLAKVRDSERQSEVNTLYDAIQQYNIDNGQWPSEVENMEDDSAAAVCADGVNDGSCINLTDDLTPAHLAAIPADPQAAGNFSGYHVVKEDQDRLVVTAYRAEEAEDPIKAGTVDTQGLVYSWYTAYPSNGLSAYFDGSNNTFEGAGIYADSLGGWSDAARPSYLPEDYFAWKVEGEVYAPKAGDYTFSLDSDDQSDVTIDRNVVVTDDSGSAVPTSDPVTLSEGWHTFRVRMQEHAGSEYVKVEWQKPSDSGFSDIPLSNLRP